ncbi:MAG: flagellar export chaperone FliS [Clostridia bacterium]|nr:flagellar export chaperone FliS [Clostridia bacterium]
MTANAYSVYKEQAISTGNPREVIGKLFNASTVALRRAAIAIREKRLENANNDILHAENIVFALDHTLDMQYPVAGQLHELYNYMLKRMIEANLKKSDTILDEVAGYLSELRDTWEKAQQPGRA